MIIAIVKKNEEKSWDRVWWLPKWKENLTIYTFKIYSKCYQNTLLIKFSMYILKVLHCPHGYGIHYILVSYAANWLWYMIIIKKIVACIDNFIDRNICTNVIFSNSEFRTDKYRDYS